MRILQLHCDSIEYTATKKEIAIADDIEPGSERFDDIVAVFVAVEKGDDAATASRAMEQIRESMARLGCKRLLLYPYAHLSSHLASPAVAISILSEMASDARDIELHRAPFGWTKSYQVRVKGHPLAESAKTITPSDSTDEPAAVKSESKIKSFWYILSPDGVMTPVDSFDFAGYSRLEMLAKYEAAKRRAADGPPPHVALMKKMAIADYEPASDQGNMRFYPNGRLIKSLIERYVTERVRRYGGYEVETPIMYDSDHPSMVSYFNRFPARQYSITSENRQLFLRFAACFGQFLMANDFQMSYRNLPYRLYELTRYSFRREQSGELVGLRRLRAFTMPDCHAFCKDMDQAVDELQARFELSKSVIAELGVDSDEYEMAIRFTEDFYDSHRHIIDGLVQRHGRPVLVEMWKERFFYFVLKWEFNYIDELGKASALSTDQIDVENGKRYGIEFVDENNVAQNPVILHNSPSGAVERVMYALLEGASARARHGSKPQLPLWLAPTQARIVPVSEEFLEFAMGLAGRLAGDDIRADIDDRNLSIAKRIREAEREWIRYILVAGAKEAGSDDLSVRDRITGRTDNMTYEQFVSGIHEQTDSKPAAGLNMPLLVSMRPQIMV